MKECFKCLVTKPPESFYKHPQMADGRLNKCVECTKKDALQHRADNLQKVKAYDRERGQLPRRKKANRDRYRERVSTPEGKEKEWERARKWIAKNRLARTAHHFVSNAVRDGKLQKKPCERCGSKRRIHAHHKDYYKPLEVTWLCQPCHGKRHRELNEQKRS